MIVSGALWSGQPAGADGSIEKSCTAGSAVTLPAASVARALKRCAPGGRSENDAGALQAPQPPASIWHSKVVLGSLELKSKLTVVDDVAPAGPPVIVASGAVVSTVHVRVAGVGSPFQDLS